MNVAVVLQGMVTILWIAVVGMLALAVVWSSRGRPARSLLTTTGILAIVAVLLTSLSAGLVFIQPEERGVVISALSSKGYRDQALQPGLRFVVPFFEQVVRYPISNQNYTMSKATSEGQLQGDDSIIARTLDGQQVDIDASVIYTIDPNKAVEVHIKWQNRYQDDLVRAQSRGAVRDAVSQFRVEEVVSTKRLEMVNQIRDTLAKKLSDNGLSLVDFVLRNITFSEEYAKSVEQKQIAEQQAQQAKFVVEQRRQEAEQARQKAQGEADAAVIAAKGDAEARLVQAEAEAKALEMIAAALKNNPDLIQYTYVTKLSPNIQVMLVPGNTPYILPLPTVGPPVPGATGSTTTATPTPLPTATP